MLDIPIKNETVHPVFYSINCVNELYIALICDIWVKIWKQKHQLRTQTLFGKGQINVKLGGFRVYHLNLNCLVWSLYLYIGGKPYTYW